MQQVPFKDVYVNKYMFAVGPIKVFFQRQNWIFIRPVTL